MIFHRCMFTLLIVLAGARATQAQQVQKAHGYVQEVDATRGTITLTTFAQGKILGVKSFNLLKPDIPIVNKAGQVLKLSDVQAEAMVTLKLNKEEDVVSIIVPLPTVRGTIKEVDALFGVTAGMLPVSVHPIPSTVAVSGCLTKTSQRVSSQCQCGARRLCSTRSS